ncbi:HAD hydrolase-like protein [Duganella sp. HH101]|uniref:HAD hydrolase-like protein n=1 Tax=Duganella sp. HH101 TaxID=1781066 RepID=UPI0008734D57|nr:HAD hydrolase-like protein [Duganella sp. HH101]OFA05480.1 5'-nucleotidase [Duganella sp. HH101]
MNRQLIIFDFDGTLADTLPVFVDVFDQAADKYGFKRMDRSRTQALRQLDARQIMAVHEIPLWKVPAIATFMRSAMGRSVGHIRLFDGIDGVLRALKARGVILAVVSSNSRSNVVNVLGPELAGLFSHFECGASLFGKLPKIRKVLAATGVAREYALLVGDEIRDAKVSAEAGIDFGAVAWGFNTLDALMAENPSRVFRAAGDLLEH